MNTKTSVRSIATSLLILSNGLGLPAQAQLTTRDKVAIARTPFAITSDIKAEDLRMENTVLGLLNSKKYDFLDKLALDLRHTGASFPDGTWKLDCFYKSFFRTASQDEKLTEAQWQNVIRQVSDWATARPSSVTARVALANLYYKYAWAARGGGWARNVSDRGWTLMEDREQKALKILDEARKLGQPCPRIYTVLARIAKDNRDRRALEEAVRQGTAQFPAYRMLYFSKAIALQPRWGGRSGEWENFIRETADRVGGIEGDKFYAQQVWYVLSLHWYTESNLFREFRLDYPRIKRGFEALRSAFPASVSVLSAFCYLASQAGDKPVAWHLFKELAGRVDKDVWWGEQNFATWRNFVLR